MFDFLELLRRSASKPDATFALVGEIAALRVPFIMIQILPFAVLLGGLLCFWRLTRTSELIVARAAGVSAWEFLTVPDPVRAADGRGHDGRRSVRCRRRCWRGPRRWRPPISKPAAVRWR